MLSSVIIILREVLEAALLVSVLLSLSQRMSIGRKWILPAINLGLLAAVFLAYYFDIVSDWFDGVGQEVSNASLLLINILLLAGICAWLSRHLKQRPSQKKQFHLILAFLMAVVGISIMLEGAEILVYAYAFSGSMESFLPILTGGSIGAGIGISIGALIYYALINVPQRYWVQVAPVALIFIAAGMSLQVSLNLIQADWLPSQMPLWDTSSFLPETSVLGQLLYALLGYEATPTAIQVGFYMSTIIIMTVSVLIGRRYKKKTGKPMEHGKKVLI